MKVVDAFTTERFRGNPAAVCVLPESRPDVWMADVAREMNLSETAFLQQRADGWSLRWFSPVIEIDLCGHATLASAHVLWEDQLAAPDETLRFHTRSGVLTARREPNGIVLDFPSQPATPCDAPDQLLDALGIEAPVAIARNRTDYIVQVRDAATVRALAPDMSRLVRLPMRGVMVTAPADDDAHDFTSRFFAPRVGVPEDPVTGSAHCCLAPWWAERLGRTLLRGYQASARGGTVGVRVLGDRVELVGNAITVLSGTLVEDGL